jgi:hemerythrin-like domain-containing protein
MPSSPSSASDPVANLVHDHAAIHRLLMELGGHMEALRDAQPGPSSRSAVAVLQELRELLFLHFAREEEGLFPFVVEAFPDLAWQVQSMAAGHDSICGGLSRLLHMLMTNAEHAAMFGVYERFEKAYGEHARTEARLLAAVDAGVSPAQRAMLAELVSGL